MAYTNNNSPRKGHVSPGIYMKETDLTYASNSLGITTLGVVGETVKGPAFQPIRISNWREFTTYFGGTNTEKYRGSQYPKYELPYIAKSYLSQSEQLEVVRVLGLSGVNAGTAWIITSNGTDEGDKMVVAVLRSRGEHVRAVIANGEDNCGNPVYNYDNIEYYAKTVSLEPSTEFSLNDACNSTFDTTTGNFYVNVNNYGRFTIVVNEGVEGYETKKYAVSLNPFDKNYIYNILGGNPEVGETEVYVEELYDVALKQLIEQGKITEINGQINEFSHRVIIPAHSEVDDLLTVDESFLSIRDLGKRLLCTENLGVQVHTYDASSGQWSTANCVVNHIYKVVKYTNEKGKREYRYVPATVKIKQGNGNFLEQDEVIELDTQDDIITEAVYCNSDGNYYFNNNGASSVVRFDINNYRESYRYASTPWVVSDMKGSGDIVELTKLFRFHTISDGATANTMVKVSIENVEPEEGTFDVLVRDFYDTDESPVIYERYKRCNLIEGSDRFISLLIGSFDETYETRSNFITVEINQTERLSSSVPCGFLGYPVRNYGGESTKSYDTVAKPYLAYNVTIDEDLKLQKQYFGMSNIMGIDSDILSYKGVEAYDDEPSGMTACFHLDSRILNGNPDENGIIEDGNISQKVMVDGVTGYSWSTVSRDNLTDAGIEPRIGTDAEMFNTIYEDRRARKFTVCFCGGWDGWDYYRTSRGNGDDFKFNKYRGKLDYSTGHGLHVDVIKNPEAYGFESDAKLLTTDYYAYLYGVRQFANPKTIDINVFATPGIDYVNQRLLVNDVIEMVEEDRGDCVYVVTTPDKPAGAGDTESEMYTAQEAVWNLEESEIDSNYTCSYYPWVKYYDPDNSKYIYLPVTRDVVKNFANTDNTAYPWFAAAGWNRGDINGVRPKKNLRLSEQDTLYDGRLNFVNTFAQDGMKVWGDKNMQIRETQMNRISKRRLLIRIKKLCSLAAIGLIFDPNDNNTKNAFINSVSPVLDHVMSNRGISDWRIEVDDSQEARDRMELPARIFIKPIKNLEYITIDFVITPSGVSFDDI